MSVKNFELKIRLFTCISPEKCFGNTCASLWGVQLIALTLSANKFALTVSSGLCLSLPGPSR
jgi:hypothetical protein